MKIGDEFSCGGMKWRVTDIGTRTIIAIPLFPNNDPSWFMGPPYAVQESVFDEYDQRGIEE